MFCEIWCLQYIQELYVDTLLDMDLVYNYFVRHGVQRYMRSMYGYFVKDVFVKYKEV